MEKIDLTLLSISLVIYLKNFKNCNKYLNIIIIIVNKVLSVTKSNLII